MLVQGQLQFSIHSCKQHTSRDLSSAALPRHHLEVVEDEQYTLSDCLRLCLPCDTMMVAHNFGFLCSHMA